MGLEPDSDKRCKQKETETFGENYDPDPEGGISVLIDQEPYRQCVSVRC